MRSIDSEINENNNTTNELGFMTNLIRHMSNKAAAVALGGAVVLAGSALAFTQKPKAEHFTAPPVESSWETENPDYTKPSPFTTPKQTTRRRSVPEE